MKGTSIMTYLSCLNPVEKSCFQQYKLDKYFDDRIHRYSLVLNEIARVASQNLRIQDPFALDWSEEMMGILYKDQELIEYLVKIEFPIHKREDLEKKLQVIVKVISHTAREGSLR